MPHLRQWRFRAMGPCTLGVRPSREASDHLGLIILPVTVKDRDMRLLGKLEGSERCLMAKLFALRLARPLISGL
eukprot:IDg7303t1